MARLRKHKDVEFAVGVKGTTNEDIFKTYEEAAGHAVFMAFSYGTTALLDVLVYSEAGARSWAGEHGVEQYREDPDASVFDRIEVKANVIGRVP